MLIGISIITYIVIIVINIRKKVIIFSKDIGTTHIYGRQSNFFWIFNRINVAIFIG